MRASLRTVLAARVNLRCGQMPDTDNTATGQIPRTPHGAALSCAGWQQEGILRMLLNSLDPQVAEEPQEMLLSGAAGKAAADASSLLAIVAALRRLANNEELVIRSGKPDGDGVTHASLPSPLVAATHAGSGEMLGNWLYAGAQTALPVLDEIYGDAAQHHFGGTLAGKLVVGGGLGGAGGAQPLAAMLHGAAFLGIDVDAERIKRRLKTGYCEVMVNHLDEALRVLKNAVRQRKAASVGLIGNCAEVFPELAARGVVPDLLTDYTPGLHSSAHTQGIYDLERLGTRVLPRALWNLPSQDGWRLATWLALSDERSDIARVDKLALSLFPNDERTRRWLPLAAEFVRFQGLPARVIWLKQQQIAELGRAVNDLVARGETLAPILLGWNSADAGPGSSSSRAAWTWTAPETDPGAIQRPLSAQAIVADGTPEAAARFDSWHPA
jgi:urocanate hydratase